MSEKVVPVPVPVPVELVEKKRTTEIAKHGVAPYKGFVAGVFSGVMKLAGKYGGITIMSLSPLSMVLTGEANTNINLTSGTSV